MRERKKLVARELEDAINKLMHRNTGWIGCNSKIARFEDDFPEFGKITSRGRCLDVNRDEFLSPLNFEKVQSFVSFWGPVNVDVRLKSTERIYNYMACKFMQITALKHNKHWQV